MIIEADHQSLLVGWQDQNVLAYELQLACIPASIGDAIDDDGDDDDSELEWKVLSSAITGTQIRKKNLQHGVVYLFRIKYKDKFGWGMPSAPSNAFQVIQPDVIVPIPPVLKERNAGSVTIEWSAVEVPVGSSGQVIGYTIRYRTDTDISWTTIESVIRGTLVRKKGLLPKTKYYFSVKPVLGMISPASAGPIATPEASYSFSSSSMAMTTVNNTNASISANVGEGYTTVQGRYDWLSAHGLRNEAAATIPQALIANGDMDQPLYYWQLYSMLGQSRIVALVRSFYERVYADSEEHWFRQAFVEISGVEHHISTQSAFWIDTMGGGKQYHGGDGRLSFHHSNNAKAVMTAKGATRWMYHMKLALRDHAADFNSLDDRIIPCIFNFLCVKMRKYAQEFQWKFNPSEYTPIA